ncbi:hypothetical protein DFJ74DRAFT_424133, partial [Hyaloraphidium curvatum]
SSRQSNRQSAATYGQRKTVHQRVRTRALGRGDVESTDRTRTAAAWPARDAPGLLRGVLLGDRVPAPPDVRCPGQRPAARSPGLPGPVGCHRVLPRRVLLSLSKRGSPDGVQALACYRSGGLLPMEPVPDHARLPPGLGCRGGLRADCRPRGRGQRRVRGPTFHIRFRDRGGHMGNGAARRRHDVPGLHRVSQPAGIRGRPQLVDRARLPAPRAHDRVPGLVPRAVCQGRGGGARVGDGSGGRGRDAGVRGVPGGVCDLQPVRLDFRLMEELESKAKEEQHHR